MFNLMQTITQGVNAIAKGTGSAAQSAGAGFAGLLKAVKEAYSGICECVKGCCQGGNCAECCGGKAAPCCAGCCD